MGGAGLDALSPSLRRRFLTQLRTTFAPARSDLAQTRRRSVSKVTTCPVSSESTRSSSYSVTGEVDRFPADRHPVPLVVDGALSDYERLGRPRGAGRRPDPGDELGR